jgi:hypothetical protein
MNSERQKMIAGELYNYPASALDALLQLTPVAQETWQWRTDFSRLRRMGHGTPPPWTHC